MKSYMLVRIGLNVGEEEWFGLNLREGEERKEDESRNLPANFPEKKERFPARFFRLFPRTGPGAKRRKVREENERKRRQAERIGRTEEELEKLFQRIRELTGEPEDWRCVYESGVRKAVMEGGERILPALWKKYFREEFDGYLQPFWMERLLSRAIHYDYVILGNCSGIYALLEKRARQIRSLRWLLPEAEYDGELSDFAENLYMEYGLAIETETFQSREAFRKMRLVCGKPVNILDFTGDMYFCRAEAAEGSVWLDMSAREEKRYRIAGRPGGIRYESLKEMWKQARRRCEAPKLSDCPFRSGPQGMNNESG